MSRLTPNQQLALDTKGNLALTANAGSGKTFVLARRFLNALIKDELEISSIAAITFTDKAASELYNRISGLVDEHILNCKDSGDRKKLERIRRQLVSANISTIHSFCTAILRDYPVESNLDARFIPIDEKLSLELIEMSVEETIRNSFDDKSRSEDVKYLIRILGSKSKLMNQLVKLIQNRKNVKVLQEKIYSQDESLIAEYFRNTFSEFFIEIWDHYKSNFIGSLEHINNQILSTNPKNTFANQLKPLLQNLIASNSADEIILLLNSIKELIFTSTLTIKKRGYLTKEISESLDKEVKRAESLISELNLLNLCEEDSDREIRLAHFGETLLNVFDNALRAYESIKKAEGYIDYEDILLYVKQLLQNPSVQNSLADKYKLIMVDEFQDTNEIQYQIFLPILDYLKRGNLFIVGDEKQSIYKFRDAEIEIFNLTRNDIQKASSKKNLLVLPDSFRMSPEICAFSNNVFRKIFNEPVELFGDVPAADLICARNGDTTGKIEFLIKIEDEETELNEAGLLIKKIKQIINNSAYRFSDIAVLVRKRKHFESLEKELIIDHIPYSIVGGRGFYQRQSINDIFNYLTFLSDKNNNTALVGILRSPFFNISDSVLYKISLLNGRSFWTKLNKASKDLDLEVVIDTLNENLSLCNSLSFSQLIEKLITDNDYLAILNSRIDGNQEIANVFKLINIARNFNATGFRNLYDFINYLKGAISESTDESQALSIDGTDAVKIMTIHQAKGLEFPIVFLYKTDESSLQSIVKTGEVIINKEFGLLTKLPKGNEYFEDYHSAPIISLHNFLEAKKNYAELKRLLYVAITRAKDQLYISGTIKKDKPLNRNSFLALLGLGLNTDFISESITISEELNFLLVKEEKFVSKTKRLNVQIDITKELEDVDVTKDIEQTEILERKTFIQKLDSNEKWEIISASKVSIYSQCPLKYYLTYESGFSKLNSFQHPQINYLSNQKNDFEEGINEAIEENIIDSQKNYSTFSDNALYGKIFHNVMEKNIRYDEIEKHKASLFSFSESGKFIETLNNDLKELQESEFAKEILSLPSFKNEFEIYINEQDYFLHGIIDRIIFDKNRLIICDYKTDNIAVKEIKKHSEYYLMQLKFYLYISSRLFGDFEIFEGKLIFIKHPDNVVSVKYSRKELNTLEKEIKGIILNIRSENFEKNLSHCRVCSFSDSANRCVIN